MPDYIKDPNRDHNSDNHPHLSALALTLPQTAEKAEMRLRTLIDPLRFGVSGEKAEMRCRVRVWDPI